MPIRVARIIIKIVGLTALNMDVFIIKLNIMLLPLLLVQKAAIAATRLAR